MKNRLDEWREFSLLVEQHIQNYANVQYGNQGGDEQIDGFTVEDCWNNVMRYYNRRRSAVRGRKEQKRDVLKVAHYMQFIHSKMGDSDD